MSVPSSLGKDGRTIMFLDDTTEEEVPATSETETPANEEAPADAEVAPTEEVQA